MSRSPSGATAGTVLGALATFAACWLTRGRQSLDFDECFTLWVAGRPVGEVVSQANLDGFTPPAFYFLVKALAATGLALEDLRVLPAAAAGLATALALASLVRTHGSSLSTWIVGWGVFVLSPLTLGFGHELRPYSVLLACAWSLLSSLSSPPDGEGDWPAVVAALIATLFSYLGLFLVILWAVERARSVARVRLTLVVGLGLLLCLPAAFKVLRMAANARDGGIVRVRQSPDLAALVFGLSPGLGSPLVNGLLLGGVALLLVHAARSRDAALRLGLRAFLLLSCLLFLLGSSVETGFAPRYMLVPASALLFTLAAALARSRRFGLLGGCLAASMHLTADVRYLTENPPPRENWREALGRIERVVGPEGTLLSFPFHHGAVVAAAYSPRLRVGGGYGSRTGPVYWYAPPKEFRGYIFDDLKPASDPVAAMASLAPGPVCLLTDEPDPSKTRSIFDAFRAAQRASEFDTGDPRLRALCRLSE